MANEITVSSILNIVKDKFQFRNIPGSFQDDLTSKNGPAPGAFIASVEGTDVDFTNLSSLGYCILRNNDTTNFVTVGIWDGVTFYPMLELPPACPGLVVKLSRYLSQEYGTGTGTTGASINTLRLKADTANCNVSVEAFER